MAPRNGLQRTTSPYFVKNSDGHRSSSTIMRLHPADGHHGRHKMAGRRCDSTRQGQLYRTSEGLSPTTARCCRHSLRYRFSTARALPTHSVTAVDRTAPALLCLARPTVHCRLWASVPAQRLTGGMPLLNLRGLQYTTDHRSAYITPERNQS